MPLQHIAPSWWFLQWQRRAVPLQVSQQHPDTPGAIPDQLLLRMSWWQFPVSHIGCHGAPVATSVNYSAPQVPSPASPGSTESRRGRKKSPQTIRVILATSEQAQGLVLFGRAGAAYEPFIKTRTLRTAMGKGVSLLFGFIP